MLGLGGQELILLLVLGVLLFGAPLVIAIAFLVMYRKRPQPGDRVSELEAENRRLRDEIDRMKSPAHEAETDGKAAGG